MIDDISSCWECENCIVEEYEIIPRVKDEKHLCLMMDSRNNDVSSSDKTICKDCPLLIKDK